MGLKAGEKRYILNLKAKRVHDRRYFSERCNSDQILLRKDADPQEIDELLRGGGYWRLCRWCYRP